MDGKQGEKQKAQKSGFEIHKRSFSIPPKEGDGLFLVNGQQSIETFDYRQNTTPF